VRAIARPRRPLENSRVRSASLSLAPVAPEMKNAKFLIRRHRQKAPNLRVFCAVLLPQCHCGATLPRSFSALRSQKLFDNPKERARAVLAALAYGRRSVGAGHPGGVSDRFGSALMRASRCGPPGSRSLVARQLPAGLTHSSPHFGQGRGGSDFEAKPARVRRQRQEKTPVPRRGER